MHFLHATEYSINSGQNKEMVCLHISINGSVAREPNAS